MFLQMLSWAALIPVTKTSAFMVSWGQLVLGCYVVLLCGQIIDNLVDRYSIDALN